MTSMIVRTTPELFKGNGVYRTDHLSENRMVSRSNRLVDGPNRFPRTGTIHCQGLSIARTGLHRDTKTRAILSPVSDPAASIAQKVHVFLFRSFWCISIGFTIYFIHLLLCFVL